MMDDEDECPDSTVMMDDDEDDMDDMETVPFNSHHLQRRSVDEPQSSRISSTASPSSVASSSSSLQFGNFSGLPPLPKLIFRPPTHAGHYPSVSFSPTNQPQHGSLPSRHSHTSSSSSSSSSRLSQFPSSSSSPSSGTTVSLSAAPQGLPRLEQMSRSELTISRVGSLPQPHNSRMSGVSSTSRTEFARVGGVSISRVDSQSSSPFPRVGSSSTTMQKRIAIPALQRIGQGRSSMIPAQDMSPSSSSLSSRKFGRRFLKSSGAPSSTPTSSSQPQMQRMPMGMLRAASTEEYYPPQGISGSRLSTEGPSSAVDNESAVNFNRQAGFFASSSRKSSEMLTSQQGPGIKLHISKKRPVEIIEVDDSSSERSTVSMASSIQNNSDSNIGPPFDFSSPSVGVSGNNSSSALSNEEMSVKPIKLIREQLNISKDLIIDEAEVNEDEDTKDTSEEGEESQPPPFIKRLMMDSSISVLPCNLEGMRRTRRKREPQSTTLTEIPTKMRRRRGGATVTPTPSATITSMNQAAILVTSAPENTSNLNARGGRGRGSGRGRGRPRGSTNKAKLEREQAQRELLQQQIQIQNQEQGEEVKEIKVEEEVEEVKPEVEKEPEPEKTVDIKEEDEPVVDTTTTTSSEPLPLGGDPEVNAEVSSATSSPAKKTRGGRGSRRAATPKTPRASRGTARGASKSPREKKSPEGKKQKAEKKEGIKAPPPVQVFEEETRMSSTDVKVPIPDRLNSLATPIPIDEESRASNVSSTSLSTAAKAKRFTKDPIEERKPVTAETLYEYQWPPTDKNADFFFLQEQISEYLGVKSFKRKYPDIRRRVVDMEERDFLRASKVVSETQCDLGLTAVHSCDVLDIMFNDFSEKYEEYRKVFQERKDQEMSKLKPQTGTETAAVRDRSAEFMRRILKSCAKWNYDNNRDRMEERRCAFDLQTGTLHYPKNKMKVLPPEATQLGKYPVAVLPGQFTDNYKKYTPDELFYLPLNTVRYGPIRENFEISYSSESDFESDESSSSDDSSSSSSEDDTESVADLEQNQIVLTDDAGSVLYRGPSGLTKVSTEAKCKSCDGTACKNKDGNSEVLLHCSRCDVANHPTCLELTLDMLPFITKYLWECTECKNCIQCNDPADEDKMLFCDCCDRGYHIYCVGLRKVPTGRWHCSVCAVCYSCGVTQPSPEERTAEWHHEFRKGEKGAKFYLHSLCVACHKLYRKGLFCPSCSKVHTKLDKEVLMECRKCEKWVHKACVKRRPLKSMFGFMCDPCDANFRKISNLPSHVN